MLAEWQYFIGMILGFVIFEAGYWLGKSHKAREWRKADERRAQFRFGQFLDDPDRRF